MRVCLQVDSCVVHVCVFYMCVCMDAVADPGLPRERGATKLKAQTLEVVWADPIFRKSVV